MLMAQLRGKLATQDWANKEDLLTSAVLGVLKNSPPSVPIQLLSLAKPLRGETAITLSPQLIWTFWPQWDSEQHQITIEPDVVLQDSRNLVVIEAKLHSDFGESETTASQLQLEWEFGLQRTARLGKALSLLVITNHATLPTKTLERQLPHHLVDRTRVYWLSWFQIGRFLNQCDRPEIVGWCQDLHALFTRMGLAPFDGFDRPAQTSKTPCPWADRVIFDYFRAQGAGFASSIRLAEELNPMSLCAWRLPFRAQGAGFASSIRLAEELNPVSLYAWRLPSPPSR